MSFRYRVATVEGRDRAALEMAIEEEVGSLERVTSASFSTRETGPEYYSTFLSVVTLLIEWEE